MGRRRRRGPAAFTRLAATGISTAGGIALVGVMAASSGSSEPAPAADAAPVSGSAISAPRSSVAPPEPIVIIEVHRTVYVDEAGNPVDPANAPGTVVAPGARTTSTTGPRRSATRTPGRATSTTAVLPPSSTTTTSAPPRCEGSNCP